jgi:hypothetical protein
MELAIIGGLALVGWSLSPAGVSRRVQHTPRVNMTDDSISEYPFDPDTSHQELLETDTRQVKSHVRQARAVLQEYSKSDKTAAADTQRKMELFTGSDNLQWKKKDDVPRLFEPEETSVAVSSGGKALSTASYDPSTLRDRNVFGSTMNNALPFAQERVGPGLGVDASVPSTDGLHSQFRVLPTHTLNAYRTNQLPGRSTAGGALVGSGSRRFDTFTQMQPSLVNHTPNPGPGRTSFQAQTVLDRDAFYPTIVQKHTRSEGMRRFPHQMGGCVSTCGAPVHPHVSHVSSKREMSVGVSGRVATQYEMYERSGHNIRDPKAGSLHMTTDQSMRAPGYAISTGTVRRDMSSSNQRESEHIQGVGGSSYLAGPSARSRVRRSRKACSEGRAQHGALPGGVAVDMETMGENVIRKSKRNAFERRSVAGRAPYAQQRESGGRTTTAKKLASDNPHGAWDSLGLGLVDVRDT